MRYGEDVQSIFRGGGESCCNCTKCAGKSPELLGKRGLIAGAQLCTVLDRKYVYLTQVIEALICRHLGEDQ